MTQNHDLKIKTNNSGNLTHKYIDYTWAHNDANMMENLRDFSSTFVGGE